MKLFNLPIIKAIGTKKYVIPTLLVALLALTKLNAQSLEYENFKWEEKPVLTTLDTSLSDESEVILKLKRSLEFVYDESAGDLRQYSFYHKIVKVNSDDALEANNKVYLPMRDISKVLFQRARVITSTGKIIELDENDIKEAEDEENKKKYKYFALEGVDVGSEIETMYLLEVAPYYTGNDMYFQSSIPYKNVEMEIISPSNLIFHVKEYNGFPKMEQDTTFKEKNVLRSKLDYAEKLDEEDFAVYEPNLMHISYKLGDNLYKGSNLISYNKVSSTIYGNLYPSFDKNTIKVVKKLSKTIGTSKDLTDEENIMKIENYLKTKIQVIDFEHPKLKDPVQIIANSMGNETGISILYGMLFNQLEIEHQLVLTTNRLETRFDPEFEAYHFLKENMFYFPKLNKYLAPAAVLFRLNCPPYQYTSNYGLFIKPVTIGEFTSGIGKIQFIEPLKADQTVDKMEITVRFKEDMEFIEQDIHKESKGYYAQQFQPVYEFLNEDQKKELSDAVAKFNDPDGELDTCTMLNMEASSFGVKPMMFDAKMTSNLFLERAGDKTLFKIGLLIGQQSEMYSEKERKLPIENDFNRYYKRILKINIPEGYEVSNLEKLTFSVKDEGKDGEPTMAFLSKYELKNNVLTVEIDEYYNQIYYPLEQFEIYRQVINAAADFNKVVLVLKKRE